ncbi:MAG: LuxR family transcriptional regulator [Pseudomonadota bacterium]
MLYAPIERFGAALRTLTSFDDLRAAFIEHFHAEGVRMMSYHHLPPPGASDYDQPLTVIAEGFPDAWVQRYTDDGLHDCDPITRHAQNAFHAFWWSDARAFADLDDAERNYLVAMDEAALGDGLAVPLFGPHGRNGYAGLGCGCDARPYDDDHVMRLQLAAQLGHQQYCHILFAEAPDNIRLSKREREVLEWVAKGKSNSVIAEIVGISMNTVDTYLRRIYEKLDVSDRVTASLRGLAVGLIA